MASTIRRLRRSVQKAAKAGGLDAEDTALAEHIVQSIARNGCCHLSEVGRMLDEPEPLIDTERRLSAQLAARDSTLDALRHGWLKVAAPTARRMSFIAVDATEHVKQYGKAFEFLDTVRDASDRLKRIEYGYWSAQIDAVDEVHGHLPLCSELFSTKAPEYKSWYDAFLRPMLNVIAAVGREHTWLFDRGFDAIHFLHSLVALRIHWVVRQQQTRLVLLGVEDFRVRRWESIRRLTFLALMTCGVQALLLLTRPSVAERYIARVKQFIEHILLKNYRLWRGVADALYAGA